MLLVKNPQFQTNQADILKILYTHVLIILTNFHYDSAKIVNFSSIAYFGGWVKFFYSVSTYKNYLSRKNNSWASYDKQGQRNCGDKGCKSAPT